MHLNYIFLYCHQYHDGDGDGDDDGFEGRRNQIGKIQTQGRDIYGCS